MSHCDEVRGSSDDKVRDCWMIKSVIMHYMGGCVNEPL